MSVGDVCDFIDLTDKLSEALIELLKFFLADALTNIIDVSDDTLPV